MPGGNLAVQIRCALGTKACSLHEVQIMTNSAADGTTRYVSPLSSASTFTKVTHS